MKTIAVAADTAAAPAMDALKIVIEKVEMVEKEHMDKKDLKDMLRHEAGQIRVHHDRVKLRLDKICATTKASRESAARKESVEIEDLRKKSIVAMRQFMATE